jgi:Spy/CpxP family protein refolding chaperone
MKWVRFGLVPLLVLALASVALAQDKTADAAKPAATAKSSAAMAKSPEEMAKEALAKWKDVLKLTAEQTPQFESVMTDSYQKMADAKTAAAGDKAKMKASLKTIMSDRDQALAKVLTPEQMKIYHEKMAKMNAKAKEHMSKTTEGTSK